MEAVKKSWNEIRYEVTGCISLIPLFYPEDEFDERETMAILQLADMERPWISRESHGYRQPRMEFVFEKNKKGEVDKIRFSPKYALHPKQFYAFYKNVYELAKKVLDHNSKNTACVDVSLEMNPSTATYTHTILSSPEGDMEDKKMMDEIMDDIGCSTT